MTTGIKASGTDLDALLEPRTTTKIANVNIDSNGGVDISNRFEAIASGSAPSVTNIKSGGTDLNALFAAIGTVSPDPEVSPLANGQVSTKIGIQELIKAVVQFNTTDEEFEVTPSTGV